MMPVMKQNLFRILEQQMKYCTAVLTNKKPNTVKPLKVSSKIITPKLSKEQLESVNYVTGIHMGTTCISWALLHIENNTRHHLLDWNHMPFPPNTQKLHIHELSKLIFEARDCLPESDLYVTESLNPVIRSSSNPVLQVALELISQLQSMLCVALSESGSALDTHPKLVFLKNRSSAKLFNLLLKSECITSRHIIENLIQSQTLSDTQYYSTEHESEPRTRSSGVEGSADSSGLSSLTSGLNFHTRVLMDEMFISRYDTTRGYPQESLALALLYAICFTGLVARPNENVVRRMYLAQTTDS
uniref:Transcription elongation factor, mitochondrial n=1 Tax=Cacopsylla melanoneura TaxID=428564 RepID=A0A8D9DZC8_9HEMI